MAVEPVLLEIDGLCEYLSIGKNTAYELVNSGEIEAFKISTCWKIPKKSVDEYIERKCKERKCKDNDRKLKVMCRIVKQ